MPKSIVALGDCCAGSHADELSPRSERIRHSKNYHPLIAPPGMVTASRVSVALCEFGSAFISFFKATGDRRFALIMSPLSSSGFKELKSLFKFRGK